jgi:predicted metalloprotease with PDZ domain
MDQTTAIIFFFAAILIIGGLLFIFISIAKNSPKALDVEKYRSRWLRIETALSRNNEGSHTLCVLNADKLLDQALRDRGIAGKTMAERMKSCQGKWTNGNGLWAAHKVRNRLAHETDATIDYERARQALVAYKQALKDVGAI